MNNDKYYKYSSSSIKKRNPGLWCTINSSIILDVTFKCKFYMYENDITEIPKCECSNDLKFTDMVNGFRSYCSRKCMTSSTKMKEKRKNTNILKYGVDNPAKSLLVKEKVKQTNIKNFGTEYPLQSKECKNKFKKHFLEIHGVDNPSKLPNTREKAQNTMLEKYGVEHAMQSKEIQDKLKEYFLETYKVDNPSKLPNTREKAQNTMLEKYGVEHALQSPTFITKSKETNLNKYGTDSYTKTKEYQDNLHASIFIKNSKLINSERFNLLSCSNIKFEISCTTCNDTFIIQRQLYRRRVKDNEDICLNCNPITSNGTSKLEKELLEYVRSVYTGEIQSNIRFNNKEIDIYLPDLKLGFEFNGLYWHSELHKDKNYHYDKYKHFDALGIRVVHIWEDDWIYKKDIIKSMICEKLNLINNSVIYTSDCVVREVKDNKLVKNFLNTNHLDGNVFCRSTAIKLGLYYNNELVSLIVFKKLDNNTWELLRFCNKLGILIDNSTVVLFKYFQETFSYDKIIAFSSMTHSTGSLLKTLGFINNKYIVPKYYWCKNGIKKYSYSKDKVDIMYNNGYFRLYDCGSKKWIFLCEQGV